MARVCVVENVLLVSIFVALNAPLCFVVCLGVRLLFENSIVCQCTFYFFDCIDFWLRAVCHVLVCAGGDA